MIKRNDLLNPGPATTTETVKMAQVVPDICPRDKEFGAIRRRIQKDLARIVHGNPQKYTSVLFCGSGTICMDVCINSLLPAEGKILVINNGAYSSRAVEICKYYGLPHKVLIFDDNTIPDLEVLRKTLSGDASIKVVYSTHQETGTGILNPIREIGALAHQYDAISIVDTTSTYAMMPLDMEKDNIDFCMSSAQKGIMAMTGLSFIVGNKKLIIDSASYPTRSYYCNLFMQYEYFEKHGEMHFTPPVQTIYAANQALNEYFDEGEVEKHKRHHRVYDAIRDELRKLGFKEYIKPEYQAGLVVAVIYPDDNNWSFEAIHDYCYERGFTIYPGKINNLNSFRLCSLGAIDVKDVWDFFAVFKEALEKNKVSIPVKYKEGEKP